MVLVAEPIVVLVDVAGAVNDPPVPAEIYGV